MNHETFPASVHVVSCFPTIHAKAEAHLHETKGHTQIHLNKIKFITLGHNAD